MITRDRDTVQGCINSINDILDRINALTPGCLVATDKYNRFVTTQLIDVPLSGYESPNFGEEILVNPEDTLKAALQRIETKYADSFNEDTSVFFSRLASASEVEIGTDFGTVVSADDSVQIITEAATIYLPLADIIDTEKERARLEAEEKKLIGEIERLDKKLSNEGFVAKAPAAVVAAEREKLSKYGEKLEGIRLAISKLK